VTRAEQRTAAAAGALAALLLAQWLLPVALGLPAVAASATPSVPVAQPYLPPYPGLIPGALFSPTRQALDVDGAADGLQSYALLGVSLSPRGASALLKGPQDIVTLRLGQPLSGWRLAALTRNQARFDRAGKHIVLTVGAPAHSAAAAQSSITKEAP
jgi:hypothetical protein